MDILRPFMELGCWPAYSVTQPGFDVAKIQENLAYILDSTGWLRFRRDGITVSITQADEVQGIPKLGMYVNVVCAKIPLPLFTQITSWLKDVYKKKKTEAMGYLYYKKPTKEWDFIPPTQRVGHLSVGYDQPPKNEGYVVAGTVHSHADISAFHSGTDHKDEVHWEGIHITVGHLNKIPDYSCSVIVNKTRYEVALHEIIEGLEEVEVPKHWMEAIKLPAPTGFHGELKKEVDDLYDEYKIGRITEEMYLSKIKEIVPPPTKHTQSMFNINGGKYEPSFNKWKEEKRDKRGRRPKKEQTFNMRDYPMLDLDHQEGRTDYTDFANGLGDFEYYEGEGD